jgi:ribonuclease BN (tRNA processing enzyme)
MNRLLGAAAIATSLTLAAHVGATAATTATQPAARTRIVLLGTGTPRPDPKRSGPATAIVVNGTAYLVDAGPGVVRRAQAAVDNGIKGLAVASLQTAFITHLHSDHTLGLPDLIFTSWVQGRHVPLKLYGPPGISEMAKHILLAWQADIDIRTKGLEQRDATGATVEAHDVKPGRIYQDANLAVTAFPVRHGDVPAYGYRFDTADRSVVITGDTSPSPEVIDNCRKCDVLIHEAYAEDYRPADMAGWIAYRAKHHTTTTQLGELAAKAQPGLLIVYHRGIGPAGREISDQRYLEEIGRTFKGRVVIGQDLEVY